MDDTNTTPEILLLNPPFGSVTSPYISIPVLAAYLRKQNIPITAYDIRREFYVQLLTPQNILRGLRYAKERFLDLNDEPKLSLLQIFEYRVVLTLLADRQQFKKETELLFSPFANFNDIQNSAALSFFIRAATVPYFPEIILMDFSSLHSSCEVCSNYNPFSSADLLQACEQTSYYTQQFERIIEHKILSNCHPRIVGFSVVFTSQIIPAFQCARFIKKRLPEVHITMGGPCISMHFREIREKRLFDIVDSFVLDEGEIPLELLVRELSTQRPDLRKVPGLVFLANDRIDVNAPPPSLDIEQSPPPDYPVFQLDDYLYSKDQLMVSARLSKGCHWQKCTFCRTELSFCRDYQQLSLETAYNQLHYVVKTVEPFLVTFSDESVDPRVLEYISKRLLDEDIHIKWTAHTRVSKRLTRERCKLYRDAGCISLLLGIESFSDRILTLMKKGITVEDIEYVLHEIGGEVPLRTYMIVGFPTETEEEALQGYERLRAFLAEGSIQGYHYNPFTIAPGSDIWNHPEEYGISEISVPEGSDLLPDVIHFTSPGMSREKAYQLAIQFSQTLNPTPKEWFTPELQVDHTVIPVRYDFQRIEEILNASGSTSFIYWLNTSEGELLPSRVSPRV